ncbi:MAG: glycosyltransferase [Candidatus Omnitrophota bacterium]
MEHSSHRKKTRLVILIDVLKDIQGGAERQVYETIRLIDREKFTPFLFILHQTSIPAEISQLKLYAEGLGVGRIYGIDGFRQGARFCQILKDKSVDILLTFHFASDIWGAYWGKKAGVPVIASSRRDSGFWRKKHHVQAYKLVNKWVNRIFAVSEAVKQMVLEEGVPSSKVEVVYNGVDLKRFDELAKEDVLEVPEGASLIGCVGNFTETKGQAYLLEAAVKVIEKFPKAYFILAGDGVLKEHLMRKAEELGLLDHVVFLGKRGDVPALLKQMDVCVLPSLSEGLSNSLLEYMAAGKPVVATAVGGNPEVIEDGVNGILVAQKDSETLAAKIILLLEDRRLAERLGRKARETVEQKFNLEARVRQMENSLELLRKQAPDQKQPIRIMHLISSGGFFGAERVMLSLGKSLNNSAVESIMAVIHNRRNPHLEVIEEARKHNIQVFAAPCSGKLDFKTVKALADYISSQGIDIVHSHNIKANFMAALACRKAKVPLVATNHLWTKAGLKLALYETIDVFILRHFVKKIVAVSEGIRQDMTRRGIPEKKIRLIINGIAEEQGTVEALKKSDLGISDESPVIAVVARLSWEKGHRYLIDALPDLLREFPEAVFIFFGEGPMRRELEKMVRSVHATEKVLFAGYQPEMEKIYPLIDVLVQPSLREGVPMSLLEAMSFGKAIVATDTGGVRGLIRHKDTGLLIRPGSCSDIREAVSALLNDPELRERLSKAARHLVSEKFSLQKMVEGYVDLYQEVLQEKSR